MKCPDCEGSRVCFHCNGTGIDPEYDDEDEDEICDRECFVCDGERDCDTCEGTGDVEPG